MAGEWRVTTFEKAPLEIIDGDRGTNYPNQAEFSRSGECLFLNAGNVTSSGFSFSDCMFITSEKDTLLRKGKLARNDVILTTRGTVGNTAYFDDSVPFDHMRINSGMVILRAQMPALQPRYLYFFVRSALFHSQVSALTTGSAQPQLPIRDINKIEIPIPPPEMQRTIAHILGTLDDKIELNRRMNATLEEMARALFKSWFVDFDPVRAKMEGRDTALPGEIADLFPDGFEASAVGEVPKGWRVAVIGDAVRAVGGTTPSTKEPLFWDGEISFATPKDLAPLSDPILLGTERRVTEAGLRQIGSGLLPKGTVLMSSRAPIGYLAITEIPVAVNQGFIAMICDGPLPNHYVLQWARQNIETIVGNANGTTFLEISKANFRPIQVLVPSSSVLVAFVAQVDSLHRRIVCNLEESHTLAALRDTLLPKLISGAVRLGDAERFVGAVAIVNE